MKTIPLTTIRSQIYKFFDQVIESGKPVYIKRKGWILKIDLDKPLSRTERLFKKPVRKNVVKGDAEELVDFKSWEWEEES